MSPGGGPVLVVEDHPAMLDAIITLLQGDCWTVVGARDGQEALDQLNMGLQPAVETRRQMDQGGVSEQWRSVRKCGSLRALAPYFRNLAIACQPPRWW